MENKKLSYCDFCKYYTNTSCMARPNSAYCSEAKNEYWQYINNKKLPKVKSFRPCDKHR